MRMRWFLVSIAALIVAPLGCSGADDGVEASSDDEQALTASGTSCYRLSSSSVPTRGQGPLIPRRVCFDRFQVSDLGDRYGVTTTGTVTTASNAYGPYELRFQQATQGYKDQGQSLRFELGTFKIHGGEKFGRCDYIWTGQVIATARIVNKRIVDVEVSGTLLQSCLGSYETILLEYQRAPK